MHAYDLFKVPRYPVCSLTLPSYNPLYYPGILNMQDFPCIYPILSILKPIQEFSLHLSCFILLLYTCRVFVTFILFLLFYTYRSLSCIYPILFYSQMHPENFLAFMLFYLIILCTCIVFLAFMLYSLVLLYICISFLSYYVVFLVILHMHMYQFYLRLCYFILLPYAHALGFLVIMLFYLIILRTCISFSAFIVYQLFLYTCRNFPCFYPFPSKAVKVGTRISV